MMMWFISSSAFANEIRFNMTRGATAISQQVYDLHMTIFYICCVIGLLVFGIMFWSIVHHRKSRGAKAAQFHESTRIELLWTVIPVLILIAMAAPATSTLLKMEDTSKADLTVLVTGSQWKWHYKYLEYPVAFYSLLATSKQQISGDVPKGGNYLLEVDNPLVLPVGKKIRFLMTSDDVIHSWWVPAFAVKKDANPGYINESWTRIDKPGTYRGQCAELCGKDHGFMPVVVVAKSAEEFEKWIARKGDEQATAKAQQQAQAAETMTLPQAMAQGEKVYLGHCAACHQPAGTGLPGIFPALNGSKVTTQAEHRAQHLDIVLHGKSGTAMQPFGKQLTAQELAAVITYERNAWDNKTGDLVQPAEVQSLLNPANPDKDK
ncbi:MULTISPECIES: cytochrome c oxidase subunit II [Aeromonas]|nr:MULTISPECIES: cytochrome c oxidase subunit II [Aeromonas]MEA9416742.1 cytochrome c oxidase subunit II [Aeromonas caviae]MEA9421492.1 cytochrome c oxidase subunit II [Aeromonas caviae]MEA9424978.1 cytochrome c oxidase subunit II [Aeromonas caviae]MEA9429657.1 cytochrome c oxidase subunit II [Aeromonas caviae]WEE22447.1 cytochrome c oxidase subunit II [Aeromonas caviae]